MKSLSLTFFYLFAHFVAAQNQQTNSISGIVIDSEDSASVQYVYLYLKNYPDFSALADERGEFKFFFPTG